MSRNLARAPDRPHLRIVYSDGRRERCSRVPLVAVTLFLIAFALVTAFAEGVAR